MRHKCGLATNRITSNAPRGNKYWWTEEIADARKACIAARRRLTRARGRSRFGPMDALYFAYKDCRKHLRRLIKHSKTRCWEELIQGIENDPWGLLYKVVMGKLRRSSPTLTETLETPILERLLDSLFAACITHDPRDLWSGVVATEGYRDVTAGKVVCAMKRGNPGSAPGPNGLTLKIFRRLPGDALIVTVNIFNRV